VHGPVYWHIHEAFLEWLSIRVDECLQRQKQAFMLNILIILSIDIILNYEKGAILEIAEAIIEDRLCYFDMFALSSYGRDPYSPCNIAMLGKKAQSNCWSVK
jgi:hypothetical protein